MNARPCVLAVDDTPESLALLVRILEAEGYRVKPADSGELALAAAEAEPPDLVLLDLRMKGIDGLETCRRLKASERTRPIPVIMISADAGSSDWAEGLRSGAADYIAKPLRKEELLSRVSTHLALSGARADAAKERRAAERASLHAARQAAVAELGQAALSSGEPHPLLALAAERIAEALGVELSEAFELAPDGGSLRLVAGSGWEEGLVGSALVGAGRASQAGFALLSGEPAVSRDLGAETRFEASALLRERGAASGLCVVIGRAERPFGVLGAHSTVPRVFLPEDIDFVSSMANVLAMAIARRESEESLRTSESLYRSLFENMLNGFAYCRMHFAEPGKEADFTYLAVNEAFEALTGLRGAVGKRVSELIPGIQAQDPGLIETYGRVASSGSPERFETFVESLRMWFSVSVYCPERGYFVAVFDVITERKRAENALRLQAERLRNLHEIDRAILSGASSPETIAEDAIRRMRGLLSCRRVSIGIFEPAMNLARVYSEDEGVSENGWTDREMREMDEEALAGLHRGSSEMAEDESRSCDVTGLFSTHGLRACIEVPLLIGERLIGVLNAGWESPRRFSPEEADTAREVAGQIAIAIEQARLRERTERHAAELEQRVKERTAQLEDKNKDLEAFGYSVSHDLRAPLRAISGYARVLQDEFGTGLDDEGRRILSVISASSHSMAGLIDGLLAFSRIGLTAIHSGFVDMEAMARSVLEELKGPEGGTRLEARFDPLPPALCDPGLIRQVWVNLLGNAVKFSSKKERALIEVKAETGEGEIEYTVRDNGAGFDMNYAAKLFGVFQRLHGAAEFEGTGVGLAIVQRIILRHGGRIWAEGEVGRGAAFHFTLPSH